MDTGTRMALAGIVRGLRTSGAIDDNAVATIAGELAAVARERASYGAAAHEQLFALASDVAAGRVTRRIPD